LNCFSAMYLSEVVTKKKTKETPIVFRLQKLHALPTICHDLRSVHTIRNVTGRERTSGELTECSQMYFNEYVHIIRRCHRPAKFGGMFWRVWCLSLPDSANKLPSRRFSIENCKKKSVLLVKTQKCYRIWAWAPAWGLETNLPSCPLDFLKKNKNGREEGNTQNINDKNCKYF
jgi:hypothetical protein